MATCPNCRRLHAASSAYVGDEGGLGSAHSGAVCYVAIDGHDAYCADLAADLARKADAELLAAARCFPVGLLARVNTTRATGKLVVYLAHPVGAATVDGVRANLARAKRWLWAVRRATEWSICAPWIPSVEAVLDSGADESAERARGLADDLAAVERCDAIALVGGRVSSGMAMERDHAAACGLRVIDLSDEGEEPEPPAMLKMLIASAELAAELVLAGEEPR